MIPRGEDFEIAGGEDGQGWGVRIDGRVSEESNFHSQPMAPWLARNNNTRPSRNFSREFDYKFVLELWE